MQYIANVEDIVIECDQCKEWFHFGCVQIDVENIPKEWNCENCEKKLKNKKTKLSKNKNNISKNSDKDPEEENEVYCICRGPSYGNMIECDQCGEWFHFGCVHIDEGNIPKEWKCGECEKK